jgi:hypothetical protein
MLFSLSQNIGKLGAKTTSTFNPGSTTHLLMAKVKVTAKVVLTLCHAKPIIKIEWLKALWDRLVGLALFVLPHRRFLMASFSDHLLVCLA